MSSGPPTPQQGDPFASSYMHPSSNSNPTASDPFSHASSAQPSYGQPPSGQAVRDQGSFGQPSFGHPIDNQSSFGQSSAGQLPAGQQSSFGQSSVGQAPQVPQQQAPRQAGGASHNPFAAAGGFGGSSFGNAGVQHVTVHSASLLLPSSIADGNLICCAVRACFMLLLYMSRHCEQHRCLSPRPNFCQPPLTKL